MNTGMRQWITIASIATTIALLSVGGGCDWASLLNPPNNNNSNNNSNGNLVNGKTITVLGYNDLGMHCMNEDFSELMILPPYNTLHAQLIERSGEHPRILTQGVEVSYAFAENTTSSDKTNFWDYAEQLLGSSPGPDVGLTGKGLTGEMDLTGSNDWSAVGIPLTPITDAGTEDSYQLATITVRKDGEVVAQTQAVAPVSWEISCNLCHTSPGITAYTDILQKHDAMHGTTLENEKPVLCAGCHGDPALGLAGDPNVSTLSGAMHSSHASRMNAIQIDNACYACHPGQRTHCLRDVHFSAGMTCDDCHTSMEAVGDSARRPWVDLPRCDDCHSKGGFSFEQPDTLFRNSVGHGNIHCEACHGSPHAILPTVVDADNLQSKSLQGHAGKIDTCTVCHTSRPDDGFFHHAGGEDDGD